MTLEVSVCDAGSATERYARAKAFVLEGHRDEAIALLKSLDLKGDIGVPAARLLHQSLATEGRHDEAVALARKLDPAVHADRDMLLGRSLCESGAYAEAIEVLQRVVDHESGPNGHVWLVRALLAAGRRRDAFAYASRTGARADLEPVVRSRVLDAAGMLSQALQVMREPIRMPTADDPESHVPESRERVSVDDVAIGVHLEFDPEDRDSAQLQAMYLDEDMWAVLRSRGVSRETSRQDADFTFAFARAITERTPPRTIALERIDGCQIAYPEVLKNPAVVSFVKMYRYRDDDVYRLPCLDNRMYTRLLTDDETRFRSGADVSEHLEKIVSGFSFVHLRDHFRKHVISGPADLYGAHRDIDVFFAGTTQYGSGTNRSASGDLVSAHRADLVSRLNSFEHVHALVQDGRVLSEREYIACLDRSKVVVSPWGWGEACFREYEAILHGCEVIKPESYAVTSVPCVYEDGSMTFCRPDWSDLEEKLDEVLGNWPRRADDRQRAATSLTRATSPEAMADTMMRILDHAQRSGNR